MLLPTVTTGPMPAVCSIASIRRARADAVPGAAGSRRFGTNEPTASIASVGSMPRVQDAGPQPAGYSSASAGAFTVPNRYVNVKLSRLTSWLSLGAPSDSRFSTAFGVTKSRAQSSSSKLS